MSSEQLKTNTNKNTQNINQPVPIRFGKEDWHSKKKDFKKKDQLKNQKRRKFGKQSGIELLENVTTQLDDLSSFAGVKLDDSLVRKIEGLIALGVNLQTCTTLSHFTSAIFLYIRDFYETSITSQVMDYLKTLFAETEFVKQSSANVPNWLEVVRNARTNWTLVKGNKSFKHFSKLLGILVTLGLCDVSHFTFDVGGFKLFDEEIFKRHLTSFDLCDAIFGTVTYFVEGFYLCFKHKSVKPLLLNDFASLELDEEYTNIITWWDLVKNGNLEKFEGITDAEYSNRLTSLINRLSSLHDTVIGLDKKLVADKIMKCKDIRNNLVTLKVSSGTRRSPFAIELFGDSNQGKTTFGDQLIDSMLTSAELPVDKMYRAALNPGDKFFSNWTTDKLVAILDDMANEKSDFVEKPPTRAIIDICNNQMYYAPKAEIDAKGKCFVEPEIVLVTTNKKDLDSYTYSNCPYSVQRRMDLVMTVRCKPAFQREHNGKLAGVDANKVREFYTIDGQYVPPAIDDIWEIDVERAIKPDKITESAKYSPITWRGKLMKSVSSVEAIQCAIDYFSNHRKNQYAIMSHMRNRVKTLCKCKHEGCCYLQGMCPEHVEFEKQFGLPTALALETIRHRVFNRTRRDFDTFATRLESMVTKELYKHTNSYLKKWNWACLIPTQYLENEQLISVLNWYFHAELQDLSWNLNKKALLLCVVFCFIHVYVGLGLFVFFYLFGFVWTRSCTKKVLVDELKKRDDILPLVVRNTRDKYAKMICYTSVSLLSLYLLSRVYINWMKIHRKQTALSPQDEVEIQKRNDVKDVWAPVVKRQLPTTIKSSCIVVNDLLSIVRKNTVYMRMKRDGFNSFGNGLFVKSNLILVPDHFFENENDVEVECCKENANAIGGKFKTILSRDCSSKLGNTDLRLCYTGSGGSYKDISEYFITGNYERCPLVLSWRDKQGVVVEAKAMGIPTLTSNGGEPFIGGEYVNLTINTFAGLCGAPLVADVKSPALVGLHVGGASGKPKGCFATFMKQDIDRAIDDIRRMDGVIVSGSAEQFERQVLGKTITLADAPHVKSAVNYLPEDSQLQYYGSTGEMVTSRSDVRRTPISTHVQEICGVENIWGAPKMKPEWYAWQLALANSSEPGKPFPYVLLATSVRDYKKPLIELASRPYWQTKPLNDQQNICGIDGCKFIDAINLNTSIGYPLTGSKRKFVTETVVDSKIHREFDQVIKDEIERVYTCYKRGERAFTIAKACKKDEILPVAKGKCRIFYGNPIALTYLIRKYYLPVLRFIQMNPLVSECSVGINCHGPEWNEFYTHVVHFGEDRIIGGDYGKYDQKLPSQLLFAALRIMIDIASAMGYSKEDLDVMEIMTGDIVFAVINYNGDLIGLQSGTHISGNSLTAVMNGVCGSLNLRNYFYTKYPAEYDFRQFVHVMTYGDDNIGSASSEVPEFNIKGISNFLAEYGQIYTMPDKESELRPYLDVSEFEFLKRFNVYHPKLGNNVGALLDKSIFKSLHCYLRPKGAPLTPSEACAINIDTALREWFNHGEDVYEMRRQQMREVAQRAGISHMCTLLNDTYDDRVLDWKTKYEERLLGEQQFDLL